MKNQRSLVICASFLAFPLFVLAESPLEKWETELNSSIEATENPGPVWEQGLESLEKFPETEKQTAEFWYQKGRLLFYVKKDAQAREAYQKALKIDEKHLDTWFMLGVLDKFGENYPQAEANFRKALEISPESERTRGELARTLVKQDKFKQAEAMLKSGLEISPDFVEFHKELGYLLSHTNQHAAALPYFKKVCELEPDDSSNQWNLGQLYQTLGKLNESLEIFQTFQKNDPSDPQCIGKLIQLNEALDKKQIRDQWVTKMYELWKAGESEMLTDRGFYIRDQYDVGDHKVFALEYFELSGERAIKYSNNISKKNDPNYKFRISCGSYDSTNDFAKGKGELPEGGRRYHLDGYSPDAHYTYDFFNGDPGYDTVKKKVIAILSQKTQPISSSIYNKK